MSRIDPRLLETARRSVNFGVLEPIEPLLALYGAGAEASVYSDPNGALVKCRQFGEVLVEQLLRRSSTRVESSRQVDRISALEDAGVLTEVTANACTRCARPATTPPTRTCSTCASRSTRSHAASSSACCCTGQSPVTERCAHSCRPRRPRRPRPPRLRTGSSSRRWTSTTRHRRRSWPKP